MALCLFPASGALGTSTLNHLLRLSAPSEVASVVATARHPEKEHLVKAKQQGATVKRADYDEKETLGPAFEGVKTLVLISYASVQNDHRFQAHKTAIDAFISSSAEKKKHVVYCSLGFAGGPDSTESVTQVMATHLRTETYLKELAAADQLSYTIVREGIYAESTPIYTSFFVPSSPSSSAPNGKIRIPHDGSGPGVAWVKRDELGEATAKIVRSLHFAPEVPPAYKDKTLLLSGPRTYTLAETVSLLSELSSTPLAIEECTVEEYEQLPTVKGVLTYGGQDYARKWATAWEGIRRGECAVVTDTLKEVLGREPTGFDQALREWWEPQMKGEGK
ncbi:hypothetical protein JCM8097_004513 [Rhodosporidiobolus ruineniae]